MFGKAKFQYRYSCTVIEITHQHLFLAFSTQQQVVITIF